MCTSFDDELLIFDSYDSAVDSTMQASKSRIVASTTATFTRDSNWEIDLPEDMQMTYLHAVKAACSEYLRQEPLVRDTRKARAGIIKNRFNHNRAGPEGRERKLYGRTPRIRRA
jgi:hypothetical protein